MDEDIGSEELKQALKKAYSCATEDRDFDKALKICSEVIDADPTVPDGWRERAAIYEYMSRLDDAIEDITHVIQQGSREPHDYFTRGRYLLDNGNHVDAVKDFTTTIALGNERDFDYYTEAAFFHRAVANLCLGRYDDVLADCKHVADDYDFFVTSEMKSKTRVVKEAEDGLQRSRMNIVKFDDSE